MLPLGMPSESVVFGLRFKKSCIANFRKQARKQDSCLPCCVIRAAWNAWLVIFNRKSEGTCSIIGICFFKN